MSQGEGGLFEKVLGEYAEALMQGKDPKVMKRECAMRLPEADRAKFETVADAVPLLTEIIKLGGKREPSAKDPQIKALGPTGGDF